VSLLKKVNVTIFSNLREKTICLTKRPFHSKFRESSPRNFLNNHVEIDSRGDFVVIDVVIVEFRLKGY
jgi:hypothetical protein